MARAINKLHQYLLPKRFEVSEKIWVSMFMATGVIAWENTFEIITRKVNSCKAFEARTKKTNTNKQQTRAPIQAPGPANRHHQIKPTVT